jgi:LysW-gamma-L-lysine carboxypeptidase
MDEVDLLVDMVSVPSPTGDTDDMAELLTTRAGQMGLQARTDEAGNVHVTKGRGSPRVLLLCHMDTVPGDIPVRVDNGILHGRGSVDAKGCLASAMAAVARMSDDIPGTLEVVAVPDEEGPSLGARHLLKGPAPDAALVGEPSGWQGITIGYKGLLRLRYVNTTPKAHAGADDSNSAEEAVTLWTVLRTYCPEAALDTTGHGSCNRPPPTLTAINTRDDGIDVTTEMELDIRLPPDHDPAPIIAFLEDRKGDATLTVSDAVPGVIAPKGNSLVRAMLASIRKVEGEPSFRLKTGTSDMNLVHEAWPHVPVLAYGPGDSRLDHTPDERLDLSEYARAIDVLEEALGRVIEDL